jgi:hypothetical protein
MREFEKRVREERVRREIEYFSCLAKQRKRGERETKCVGPTSFLFLFWYEKKGKGTNFLF